MKVFMWAKNRDGLAEAVDLAVEDKGGIVAWSLCVVGRNAFLHLSAPNHQEVDAVASLCESLGFNEIEIIAGSAE